METKDKSRAPCLIEEKICKDQKEITKDKMPRNKTTKNKIKRNNEAKTQREMTNVDKGPKTD